MSKINYIQQGITQLEGGAFQRIFDAYLIKKYKFKNIQTLGVQTGTNKPTKGTPDSYVLNDDGSFTLICYGSVEKNAFEKIKTDILACFDGAKLTLEKEEISKIICGYLSTNLHIEQYKELMSLVDGVEIELIGIDTLSADLMNYPSIVQDYLGISIDTHQIFDIDDFVEMCDRNKMNAPLDCEFRFRTDELNDINECIKANDITIVMGPSGIGKTRLVLESCRSFLANEWQVLCVKSNGNSLFDDMRFSMESQGKYLFFFDDANSVSGFEGILSYIYSLSDNYKVKVVITVRDYAKARILETVVKYSKPTLYVLDVFSDEEIKDILRLNLGIKEEKYLNRIACIAKGNIRLAILAGIKFVENGVSAIKNAEDIFKNYYQEIFDKADLSKEELLLLAFVELAGPVMANANELFNALVDKYLPDVDKNSIFSKLSKLELIDWFKNEVVKTSDQSLGNFIIYYVFYDRRWISMAEILNICMPKYKDRIVYIINTLAQLFYSDDLKEYIEWQIKDAWNSADISAESSYLEAFYSLEPIKALCIIKKKIESMKPTFNLISEEEFSKHKNYNHIESIDITVLTGYKYLDNYSEAIELLLWFYDKRPDYFMDFYFAIINNLLYDENSEKTDCEREYRFLSDLWLRCENGNNEKFTLLYLRIVELALKTEFCFYEKMNNSRELTFGKSPLVPSEGVKRIRKKIWDDLFCLRENVKYKDLVDSILAKKHVNGMYEDDTKELVLFDFNCIYPHIEKHIDFTAAIIIDNYNGDIQSLKLPKDKRSGRAIENEEFKIFDLLTKVYISGVAYKEREAGRKNRIKAELEKYSASDYEHFFCIYNVVYDNQKTDQWQLSSGISIVFENLEANPNKYIECMGIFLKSGGRMVPLFIDKIVDYLLRNIGYLKTKKIINKVSGNMSGEWKNKLWECIDVKSITLDIANEYFCFLKEDTNVVPHPEVILKYTFFLPELLDLISKRLLNNNQAIRAFIGNVGDKKRLEALLYLYKDNIECLCKMYVSVLDYNIDYDGELFRELYNRYPPIWDEYIFWLKDNISYDACERNMFKVIWETEEYALRMKFAFFELSDHYWGNTTVVSALLFGRDDETIQKKKEWLIDSLEENIADFDVCKKLVHMVVNEFPNWKGDFIMKFLHFNKSIDDFKKLYLFPLSEGWTGSRIPLINEKIDFLIQLKDKLSGIEYIEHKLYIEEYINNMEKEKEEVELREYIENAIYS